MLSQKKIKESSLLWKGNYIILKLLDEFPHGDFRPVSQQLCYVFRQQQQQSLFVLLPNTCIILQNNIKNKVRVLAAWNKWSGARQPVDISIK